MKFAIVDAVGGAGRPKKTSRKFVSFFRVFTGQNMFTLFLTPKNLFMRW